MALMIRILLGLGMGISVFAATARAQNGWTLIWSDEFNGNELDRSKWGVHQAEPGWINAELQKYVDRRENVRVENGHLVLEARRDWFGGAEYTSGRIHTERHASWREVRVEARIQFPSGLGTWPSIFMLPDDQTEGWPKMGEFDIAEYVGWDHEIIRSVLHSQAEHPVATFHVPGMTSQYKTYVMEWFPDHFDTYVEGQKINTFWNWNTGTDQWPFNKNYHIILNFAVGGHFGGMHGVDPNIWPRQMLVDYVRVFKRN